MSTAGIDILLRKIQVYLMRAILMPKCCYKNKMQLELYAEERYILGFFEELRKQSTKKAVSI